MVEFYWVSIFLIWLFAYIPHFIKGAFMSRKGIRTNADPRADPSQFGTDGVSEKDVRIRARPAKTTPAPLTAA